MSDRPMPVVDNINRSFWEGCNVQRLVLQRCQNVGCGLYIFYPRVVCPYCHKNDLQWIDVSGRGEIESHSGIHRPQHSSFQSEVPIYFIAVRLEEGPLMYSRLKERPASDHGLRGSAVDVVFSDPIDKQRLPYFKLRNPVRTN